MRRIRALLALFLLSLPILGGRDSDQHVLEAFRLLVELQFGTYQVGTYDELSVLVSADLKTLERELQEAGNAGYHVVAGTLLMAFLRKDPEGRKVEYRVAGSDLSMIQAYAAEGFVVIPGTFPGNVIMERNPVSEDVIDQSSLFAIEHLRLPSNPIQRENADYPPKEEGPDDIPATSFEFRHRAISFLCTASGKT
jgi:hypothetical protein